MAEQNELEKTLVIDGLNEPFHASVQIRGSHRQGVRANAFRFQRGHEFFGELRTALPLVAL